MTAIVGQFRMDGWIRMAQQSDVKKYLEVSCENFTGLYKVNVAHPGITQLNLPKVPYALVRQAATTFALRGGQRWL